MDYSDFDKVTVSFQKGRRSVLAGFRLVGGVFNYEWQKVVHIERQTDPIYLNSKVRILDLVPEPLDIASPSQ